MGPKSRWGPVGWGGDRLCQTSPIPRSPDGDNNLLARFYFSNFWVFHSALLINKKRVYKRLVKYNGVELVARASLAA